MSDQTESEQIEPEGPFSAFEKVEIVNGVGVLAFARNEAGGLDEFSFPWVEGLDEVVLELLNALHDGDQ